jgi:transcriptional/translational regulatory protein YebC/TACO1
MFDRKGLLVIPVDQIDEEQLMELALEAGADDVRKADETYEVTCAPEVYSDVSQAVEDADLKTESSGIVQIPKDTVELDAESARPVLKLMNLLDDHDDVQSVSANFSISDEALAQIGEEG